MAVVLALSGQPLRPSAVLPNQARLELDLAQALNDVEVQPYDPDVLIWVARRLGYLWPSHEAIDFFGRGSKHWLDDAGYRTLGQAQVKHLDPLEVLDDRAAIKAEMAS